MIRKRGRRKPRSLIATMPSITLKSAVVATVRAWLDKRRRICGFSEWVKGREGEIYIRLNSRLGLDLATFSIDLDYRGKGVAHGIIEAACALPICQVKIENILVRGWAEKVATYTFPGRFTYVDGNTSDMRSVSVYFIAASCAYHARV